jgi:hypothetical protein
LYSFGMMNTDGSIDVEENWEKIPEGKFPKHERE